MDQAVRNKLRNIVTQCRKLLEDATAQALQGRFGIYSASKKGEVHVEDESRMAHLTDEDRDCRQDLLDHLEHIKAIGYKPREALDQLIREISFTHLNRLCAYKMMEARGLIREAVSRGPKSQGFFFYLADHPEDEKLHNSGQQEAAYRNFLDWLGGTLSEEIGVLFNPNDPANRIYPPQRVLDEMLALVNDEGLKGIWAEDETIGWVYQCFTPKELRDKARKESQAPRNSYELAFRNQFYTPRYVVQFLTDNTLGRIWYEMRKGKTSIKEYCRYLVRRPTEIFVAEGEEAPEEAKETREDLSQEELLRQPVYISHRPKKDPREIKVLDPACGSGHFLLYCFDLLQVIYEEAYDDPDLAAALRKDYPALEDLRRAMPGLILKHNLHGIDIDLRATQIAALALWLRCQRAYQGLGLKNSERPTITRSNIVCAEPMPGEADLLKEFTATLQPKVLGQLVEEVFYGMRLAGEAGSLLKIEEEIQEAAQKAKVEYIQWKKHQDKAKGMLFPELLPHDQPTLFDFADLTDEEFLDRVEDEIVAALRQYAEKKANSKAFRRRLFAEDAARGFAFVDVCRKRYDVVLMNPPFGAPPTPAKNYLVKGYPSSKTDIYASFVERGVELLFPRGTLGAITNRTGFFLSSLNAWRTRIFLDKTTLTCFSDLGHGVLDTAMVETAAYTAVNQGSKIPSTFVRVIDDPPDTKGVALVNALSTEKESQKFYVLPASYFTEVPGSPFAYWVDAATRALFKSNDCLETRGFKTCQGLITADDTRFLRLNWERPGKRAKSTTDVFGMNRWAFFAKGGEFSPFYSPLYMIVDCENGFQSLIDNANTKYSYLKGGTQKMLHAVPELFFLPGLNYTRRTTSEFNARALPAGCVFSDKGPAILPSNDNKDELFTLLGIVNSRAFRGLLALSLGAADAAARSYETGIVSKVPLPRVIGAERLTIEELVCEAWDIQRFQSSWDETSAHFDAPALLIALRNSTIGQPLHVLAKAMEENILQKAVRLSAITNEIDRIVWSAYGLGLDSQRCLETAITQIRNYDSAGGDEVDDREESPEQTFGDLHSHIFDMVQFVVGVIHGRWDIRRVVDRTPLDINREPFDLMPDCCPAMLQSPDGLPATEPPKDYPLQIDWGGILIDDPENDDDIITRIREVLELIWKDRAEAIEKEACDILGVRELRDYFRKPGNGGFWMDHVKRYSKSRRKAPIYWYLRSAKGNYGLWLYYHRLDKDILFKAVLNYVEPKIRLEEDRLKTLRARKEAVGSSGREAKQIEKDMDRQEQFVSELCDFSDKLRRAADLHLAPDLNDGVVLNISPLWELVPWKEAKKYWEELLEGKYEWSSIGKQLREKELVKN